MPAPSGETFSAEAKVAANTALMNLIDTGSAGKLKIKNSSDSVLCTFTLSDPCGSVNGSTGQLTLGFASTTVNASATGTASYAEITESDDTVHWQGLCEAGTSGVAGKCVINTLSLVSGSPVTIVSVTFG